MVQFNYSDHVSDNIPGCRLTNSNIVREAVLSLTKNTYSVLDINLVCIFVDDYNIISEWHALVEANDQLSVMRLPVHIPENVEDAMQQLQKHNQVKNLEDIKRFAYPHESFIIFENKYICMVIHENDTIYIKRIITWGSQKLVQDFLSLISQETASATLATIDLYSPTTSKKTKRPQEIVWLTNVDGSLGVFPLIQANSQYNLLYTSHYQELTPGQQFMINSQNYVIGCDDENGIFIAKNQNSG